MRTSNVIVRGIGDLATSAVGAVAGAATSTAGAVSGGAVGGGLGALGGVARGLTKGAARGRHSTAATVVTLTAVGVAGLVDWPVLLAAGGAAIVLDKAINRQPDGTS